MRVGHGVAVESCAECDGADLVDDLPAQSKKQRTEQWDAMDTGLPQEVRARVARTANRRTATCTPASKARVLSARMTAILAAVGLLHLRTSVSTLSKKGSNGTKSGVGAPCADDASGVCAQREACVSEWHESVSSRSSNVRKSKTLERGSSNANCTAVKRRGAKYTAQRHLAAIFFKSNGRPLPSSGSASASETRLTSSGTRSSAIS